MRWSLAWFLLFACGDDVGHDRVTLTLVSNGRDTITSKPTGISCGPQSSICSADFAAGTEITLSRSGSTCIFVFPSEVECTSGLPNQCVFTIAMNTTIHIGCQNP